MTVPALSFAAVGLDFGERVVLGDVTLDVAPGEIVGLAGPNGAGKTTLFRLASRVLRPDRGEIRVLGERIQDLSRRALARALAVVPQDVAVAFPFRAGEVVLMGRSPHVRGLGFESADDVAHARRAMEELDIVHLAERSMLELSGGERQLVLVARALAQDPRVLLLDEPTAHLDLRHRTAVLGRVRRFVDGGRSALVVSHDLTLSARTVDRLALLEGGSLHATGPPRDILTPDNLRRVFEIEADVVHAPDGAPVVVPRGVATIAGQARG